VIEVEEGQDAALFISFAAAVDETFRGDSSFNIISNYQRISVSSIIYFLVSSPNEQSHGKRYPSFNLFPSSIVYI